jgi:hypothetical protein
MVCRGFVHRKPIMPGCIARLHEVGVFNRKIVVFYVLVKRLLGFIRNLVVENIALRM